MAVQRELTVFTFYNSIIMSVLPLIFVLFMGAWSDKYGRKVGSGAKMQHWFITEPL